MWLNCYTQEEIAEAVGVSHQEVSREILHQTANLPKSAKAAANHLVDFEAPPGKGGAMPAIPLPLAKFQKKEALCWSCVNATGTGCPFFFAKNPLAGLEAAGATAYTLETKEGPLFKVVRCPNFTRKKRGPQTYPETK